MLAPTHPPRPRLTAKIALFALIDVFGLLGVALGGSWFAQGKSALMADFPTSPAEAAASLLAGVVLMFWAASRILRELARQAPEMQARYQAYIQHNHPDNPATRHKEP